MTDKSKPTKEEAIKEAKSHLQYYDSTLDSFTFTISRMQQDIKIAQKQRATWLARLKKLEGFSRED